MIVVKGKMMKIWVALCFSGALALTACSDEPCGEVGQDCCEPAMCSAGLSCASNGQCIVGGGGGCSAGSEGCPCQDDGSCNTSSLVCSVNTTCVGCGGIGDPCCANDLCTEANAVCEASVCAVPVFDGGPTDAMGVDTGTSTTTDAGATDGG